MREEGTGHPCKQENDRLLELRLEGGQDHTACSSAH